MPPADTNLPAIPMAPKPEDLQREVAPVVAMANDMTVDSDLMYESAGDELRSIKDKFATLEERRKAITQPLDAAKKAVMDLFRVPTTALTEAEAIIKRKMIGYSTEQERKRDEAARIAREALEREQARITKEAEEARESGDEATAQVLEQTADVMTAPASVAHAAPVAAGIATTKRWSAEVEDKAAFIDFCLTPAGEQYFDALTIDMKPLNQMATALKDKMNIPGVKAVSTVGLSARS